MLDLINRYAHGFVAVPVILACREQGLFELLREPMTSLELARVLSANEGHLQVALRLLHSLNWLERNEQGDFCLTELAKSHQELPSQILSLYQLDMSAYLQGEMTTGLLREWIDRSLQGWHVSHPLLSDFLDGVLVIPLLLALHQKDDCLEDEKIQLSSLAPLVREEYTSLFVGKGWAHRRQNHLLLTQVGRFLVERAFITGVTASYRPMLAALPELLFGDPSVVFGRDASGHEGHLDRTLNVVASGFQHEKYFSDVDEIILEIFNRPPATQPTYVADMGCGDGSLLARVYEVIREKSARGGVLEQYPVVMIGIDYNQKALEATARTLSDIPHLLLRGDIGNPEQLVADLAARGIKPEEVLHIRSFLDHDRPFIPPQDAQALQTRTQLAYGGVYVDASGASIPPYISVQSLVEHFGRWANVVGKHGLIILEVHSLAPEIVSQFLDQSENLHFDALQAASQQHLVEADIFLLAAAEAGLFPKADFLKRYPRTLPFTRISLSYFEKRPYTIRHPQLSDLDALVRLEDKCWPEPLRASTTEIAERLERPSGHCLVELDGAVVGVIYSQRIEDADALKQMTFRNVSSLYTEQGPIIQLLAANVLPEMQHYGLGDQLLEFMLQYCALKSGIERVMGVTLCKNYVNHSHLSMEEYIQKRNSQSKGERGKIIDPILHFHESHGATIKKVIDGYRPEDYDNLGKGILIEYDLHHRQRHQILPRDNSIQDKHAVSDIVAEAVRDLLPPKHQSGFSPQRPLMEMGLDSLDLLELRTVLAGHLGKELEPTFFFRYGTPAAITRYFEGQVASSPGARSNDFSRSAPTETPEVVTTSLSSPFHPREFPQSSFTSEAEERTSEAIAIIGMACRFPGGASNPEDYWSLLRDGVDAITQVPQTRWDMPRYDGQIKSHYGGFLEQVDQFDASFFRMAPVEAVATDPQQRLLLEVTWEALERAGYNPVAKSEGKASPLPEQTGVFVGIFTDDYKLLQVKQSQKPSAYFGTGTSSSVAAGRLSYFFGFQGPAIALDTACSSSLVALHLANQSLLRNECDLALASGVNLLLSPELSITFSQAGMLAPDGRCKTFDASADGYVRSEGCGVVVLKRLSDARRDNDQILAVVRGTAINQDGTSNGLTAPNGLAQEAVIQKALAAAGVQPAEVSYIEAHGTGTSLGDPVEVKALEAVYGVGRTDDNPLIIGSVKTNIGHTEAAAGLAGLMKVVLSMQHQSLPPHLHFKEANPHLDLAQIPAQIPTTAMAWQNERRLAGISSFGFSGTNAHVILEEAPRKSTKMREGFDASGHLLTLSAQNQPALQELAQRYAKLDLVSSALADICFTANTGRAHFEHRLVIVTESADLLGEQLEAFAAGEEAIGLVKSQVDGTGRPKACTEAGGIAFLFTGQGSQYVGMGRRLYESEFVFRQTLDRCDELLQPLIETSLLDILYPSSATQAELINQTAYTQPALFALEYALAKLWQSWGIEPDVVMGHSVGEYVAACVAGVFSLEDGLRLIAERGRLMQSLPQDGQMVAILAAEETVAPLLALETNRVSFAAINGPNSVVISGEWDAVERVIAALPEGIRTIKLSVSHAFHSPLMEPILERFREVASQVTFWLPQIALIGNITGKQVTYEVTTPEYWVRHIRQAVRFADGMNSLQQLGIGTFVELGPKATLLGMGRRCLPNQYGTWLPSLRPDAESSTLLSSVAQLYVQGVEIDWAGFYRGKLHSYKKVVLPTYPFQRQRYWLSQASHSTRLPQRRGAKFHPLLGQRLRSALKEILFESAIAPDSPAYLTDHRVYQKAVLPAAAYLEMALAAAATHFKLPLERSHGKDELVIEEFVIEQALIFSDDPESSQTMQVILSPQKKDQATFQIYSVATTLLEQANQDDEEAIWTRHATGKIGRRQQPLPMASLDNHAPSLAAESLKVQAYYEQCQERGLEYGPSFQVISELWRHKDEAWATIELPQALRTWADTCNLHPVLLDGCLQLCVALLPEGESYLPVALDALHVLRRAETSFRCHACLRPTENQDTLAFDLHLFDVAGTIATVEGVAFKRVSAREWRSTSRQLEPQGMMYEIAWQPKALVATSEQTKSGRWLIFTDVEGIGKRLPSQIKEHGEHCVLVSAGRGSTYRRVGTTHYQIDPTNAEHFRHLLQESGPYSGVVYLWGLDTSDLKDELHIQSGGALHLVQALTGAETSQQYPLRLWLVTKGAQSVGTSGEFATEPLHVEQAPLWGLGQVIALEHPDLHCVRLDLDPDSFDDDQAENALALWRELSQRDASQSSPDQEEQVAYRQGIRHVARLVRYSPSNNYQVMLEQYGLDNLRLEAMPEHERKQQLEAKEVEIQVQATGLNFRDVLRALGMLHQYEGLEAPDTRFGFECAGVIVRVGDQVGSLAVGDEVIAAMALGSLASKVRVKAEFVVPKPQALTHTEAATIPLAFLTAYYGLQQLAQLRPGERVLIHSAAGGVGQAAVQLAQLAGAELFVTASEGKWDFLKSLGIEPSHIMNSRTLDFAEQVMRLTGGEGVDVVLNSLNNEFIPKSLELLAWGGRFVEIGKIGIWDEEQLHLMRPDVEYFPFDLLEISQQNASVIKTCLHDLMALMRQGALSPLPHLEFPLQDVVDAFGYMAQAKHIGKVVISQESNRARIDRHLVSSVGKVLKEGLFDGAASYLITGGLGALGLQVAEWLVEEGAKQIYLTGRSAAKGDALEAVRKLAEKANVHLVKADVSNYEEMARVVAEIDPPLRGIVHAAGVLDDGVLQQQSIERFEKVMSPKIWGAWNLHTLTKDISLDFFVCFSSVASLIGSAGQGNYAAANAFMDALAHHRRALGLPALSINWGPWQNGMAKDLTDHWTAQGIASIAPQQGIELLAELMGYSGQIGATTAQVGVVPVDWSKFRPQQAAKSPFFEALLPASRSEGDASATKPVEFMQQLLAAPSGKRHALLERHVRASLGKVLGFNSQRAQQIGQHTGFAKLGMDSLTSVQLRNQLQRSLPKGFLSQTVAFDYPTLKTLVDYLASQVLPVEEFENAAPLPRHASVATNNGGGSNDMLDHGHQEPFSDLDEEEDAEEIAKLFAEQLGMDWEGFDE